MRLSDPAVLILASLIGGAKHGYGIIMDIETHTGRRLGPGTLYGAISRLERDGLIRALEAEERGRQPYRITSAGKRAYDERLEELALYQRVLKALSAS